MAENTWQAVSPADQNRDNVGKKRVKQMSEWSDRKRKRLRNTGQAYITRKGKFVPGKMPPNLVSYPSME